MVLTLTVTPAVNAMCTVWCGAHGMTGPAAARCHIGQTAPGAPRVVTGAHECDTALQYMPFTGEELQRVGSRAAQNHAVVSFRHQIGRWHAGAVPSPAPALSLSPASAAFLTVLRI